MRVTSLRTVLGATCSFLVLGCGSEGLPTAPADTQQTAFAKGGNAGVTSGPASNPNFAVDEQRYWHARWYPYGGAYGTYRICYINPLEDQDGNDWVDLSNGHHKLNEKDAIVLVKDLVAGPGDWIQGRPKNMGEAGLGRNDPRWVVSYIGRGRARMTFWTSSLSPINPYDQNSRVDAVGAAVTGRFADEVDAVWSDKPSGHYGHDPFVADLRPGQPAVQWVDELLEYGAEQGSLRHVECDAVFNLFDGRIRRNEVITDAGPIPGSLMGLVPGAKGK